MSEQVFECIGRGGRYTIVATALGSGTMRSDDCYFVYRNEEGVHFVRTHEDFWERMQEIKGDEQ